MIGMKKSWNELVSYVSKEQVFRVFLYLGITAYLKNTNQGTPVNDGEIPDIRSLKQLGKILGEIPGDEIRRAAKDFEDSIDWELFVNQEKCCVLLSKLKKSLEHSVKSYRELKEWVSYLSEQGLDDLNLTPESINKLIAALPVNETTVSVADFFCGLSGTGLTLLEEYKKAGMQVKLTGIEQRKLYCDISRLLMFCYGIERPEVIQTDIIKEQGENTYDLVIADLPKGKNESMYVHAGNNFLGDRETVFAEWVAIQQALNQVTETGKAMLVVTKGALVRQREKEIRKILTKRDWLEGVITLPANLYAGTQLGFELLVFNKCKPAAYREKVFFADLSDEEQISNGAMKRIKKGYRELKGELPYSVVVPLKKIEEKEFSWNPFLYLQMKKRGQEERGEILLGEIAEIHRGAQVSKWDEASLSVEPTHYWLNIRNIGEQGIFYDAGSMIRAKTPDWEEKFGIQKDDIILTSKGAVLKICMVERDMPKAFLCGNLTRIRVDPDKYSPYILYEYLKSEDGQVALECIQSGTTIKVLNNTNLKGMSVPYYRNFKEKGEQLREIYEQYREAEKEIKSRFEEQRNKLLKELQSV